MWWWLFKHKHDFIYPLHSAEDSKRSLIGFGNRQTTLVQSLFSVVLGTKVTITGWSTEKDDLTLPINTSRRCFIFLQYNNFNNLKVTRIISNQKRAGLVWFVCSKAHQRPLWACCWMQTETVQFSQQITATTYVREHGVKTKDANNLAEYNRTLW